MRLALQRRHHFSQGPDGAAYEQEIPFDPMNFTEGVAQRSRQDQVFEFLYPFVAIFEAGETIEAMESSNE